MNGIEIYKIKVALMYKKRTYRHIEIAGSQTFADLHEAIFDAFDRYDAHLYSFFFPGKRTKSIRLIYHSPEVSHPMNMEEMPAMLDKEIQNAEDTPIRQAELTRGEVFYYLFDFGDELWHELTVLKSDTGSRSAKDLPRVVKKSGSSPGQYPDYEEDEDYYRGFLSPRAYIPSP